MKQQPQQNNWLKKNLNTNTNNKVSKGKNKTVIQR